MGGQAISLCLLSLLCAWSSRATQQAPMIVVSSAAGGRQVASMEVEMASGTITLHNIRLQGGRLAVFCMASGQDVEELLALSSPHNAVALDWEQQYHAAAGPAGGSYSVRAALPDRDEAAGCGQPGEHGGGTVAFVFEGAQLELEQQARETSQPSAAASGAAAGSGSAYSRHRALRQLYAIPQPTPLYNCSLQVGDQQLGFEGCMSVPLNPTALYQVFYTIERNPSFNTRWKGGLQIDAAAVGGQWAGFGFSASRNSMLGTEAVIVKECKTCTSGASVDGYRLVGYSPTDNVAGSFKLTDVSAAKAPDGTLVATFTAELARNPDQLLAGSFNFVFAIGITASDDSLLPHPSPDRPYGGMDMRLTDGMPSAELAPAPEPDVPAASAPACQLGVDGNQLSFAACTPVDSIGPDYTLMWTLEPATDGATSTLMLGLQAAAGGWVAVGFPASPGRMIGATAMILKTCAACASGAQIQDYFLAAHSADAVQPPGKLSVSDASAAVSSDGMIAGTIKVQLDGTAASNPTFPIILAAGPLDSGGGLRQHTENGASTANWASGTREAVVGEVPSINAMKNAHGWLMAVGWGLLIPLGILTARHGKTVKPPLWFHLHRAIQVLGLSCTLAGFIIIFVAVQQATGTSVSTYTVHRRLGIVAMSLGFFQLMALVLRPHPGTPLRKYWEPLHHWVGRAAAVVAVANIYEGIINVRVVGTWAVATYSVIFGLIVATGLGLDAYKLLTSRRNNDLHQGEMGGDDHSQALDSPKSSKPITEKSLPPGSDAGKSLSTSV